MSKTIILKIPVLILVISVLSVKDVISADMKTSIDKVIDTSWLQQATLKYGMLTSFCVAQTLTGLTEGYHWTRHSHYGGMHIVNSGNYHAFETFRRSSWAITGWFGYANWRDANLSAWGKCRRLFGSAMIGRNAFEWAYKAQRYGNPWDYSETHNKCALVYFSIRNGRIVDMYIGTGPINGPLVDITFLLGGLLLFK